METCSQKSTQFDGFFYAVAQGWAKGAAYPEQFRTGTITWHKQMHKIGWAETSSQITPEPKTSENK